MNAPQIYISTGPFQIGETMTGMGYRYWELAKGLRLKGVTASLIVPSVDPDWEWEGIEVFAKDNFLARADNAGGYVTICLEEDLNFITHLAERGFKLIFDNVLTPYESLTFQKNLEAGKGEQISQYNQRIEKLSEILSLSSFFLVGTEEEKLYTIGELTVKNLIDIEKIDRLPQLIDVLPIPFFSSESIGYRSDVTHINKSDYVWNGGLWNHYDTSFILDAFAELNANKGKEYQMHFMYRNNTDKYREIYQFVQEGNKFIKIPAPEDPKLTYYEKIQILDSAKAFILTNEHTLQSEVVLPLRMREAMLHIKPMIVSNYGILAKYVQEYGLGIVIRNDKDSLKDAILKLEDLNTYSNITKNILEFRKRFNIENILDNFTSFLKSDGV